MGEKGTLSDVNFKHSEALFCEFIQQLEHNLFFNVRLCPGVKTDQDTAVTPSRCQLMMLLAASDFLRSVITEDVIHKEDEDVVIILPDSTREDVSSFVRSLYQLEGSSQRRHELFHLFRIPNQDKFDTNRTLQHNFSKPILDPLLSFNPVEELKNINIIEDLNSSLFNNSKIGRAHV